MSSPSHVPLKFDLHRLEGSRRLNSHAGTLWTWFPSGPSSITRTPRTPKQPPRQPEILRSRLTLTLRSPLTGALPLAGSD
ncbi:hypothetical protein MJO28_008899 [Puccinia striiformis f. sp. tritici]|uniref:Uncharacterized protein n=1 Tax=Puccinia striiformis f. sp. tritici TaxID=168172 RepID=A0ACC0ED97_9BASI|nr:hypothetical protein Pst134EA_015060 [Puccinia striiformis f. sp. tritici]KAI9603205.1 hypothetical protein H4Q26_002523 [Puccinia striiformis f. sp. tritici PST-130]KAH9452226.1 hypothetical protein Pst134EB_016181 [Puccinia striiformis f. sp. tritici]KAH9462972.1 hypothetical protein Pst134EA_015060 [Puccinia striiformis f. sp. tritici]KAI7950078.1 hypothetical protein MJO28_008899 [Puccinia striiformis f. sp. tritici]KAI7953141.1 hypothetical protein MJO29_008772 [Puccinia striiformis f.